MSARSLFGAVIVVILLALYILLTRFAISLLDCPEPGCAGQFSESMASGLALISGLVSAVVIAELGLPQPHGFPFSRLLDDEPSTIQVTILRIMTFLYIGAWLGVGLWVLVATWRKPETIPALTALARSWFGLAVAAGYAYFGLKPSRQPEARSMDRELEKGFKL
jgi:hypothetical protein